MFERMRQYFSGWLAPCDGRGKVIAWISILLACGFGIYLISVGSPWDGAFLEKIESGRKPTPHKYGEIGLWWGALAGLGIALLMIRTVRWWGKPMPESFEVARRALLPEIDPRWMRWALVVGMLGAVVLGGYLRAPRLDHSLWNDEEYAVRRNIWGEWERGKDGEMRFDGLDWEEALFFNHNNNHIFHTVNSRLSLGIWQKMTGQKKGAFREAAVRFVPFLSGLGSLLALGLLGWACGIPLSGLAGAFLLAISPWHMRVFGGSPGLLLDDLFYPSWDAGADRRDPDGEMAVVVWLRGVPVRLFSLLRWGDLRGGGAEFFRIDLPVFRQGEAMDGIAVVGGERADGDPLPPFDGAVDPAGSRVFPKDGYPADSDGCGLAG